MSLLDAEHIMVTTFNPDVKSVERVGQLADGRIGFWSPDATEMAERFSEPQTVIVRICDRGGKPNLEQPLYEGRAQYLASGSVFDEIRGVIHEKYGLGLKVENAMDRAKELFGKKTPEGAVVIDIIG
ncbi:hypothetical protein AADG42_04195 [Ammonicoccus fulvus]|uniref:Uncharacterized protein n=1 Tax=Ammonicoccus fulvus TaxID=3138240 RepID=A0ABZ3FNZ4_9ACTN